MLGDLSINFKIKYQSERAAQKKKESQNEGELVVETAVDYEDKCIKELQSITFSQRKLSTSKENQMSEDDYSKKESISYLKNSDHILDKKLILLVNDKASSNWQLPNMEWIQSDPSLRAVKNLLHFDFFKPTKAILFSFAHKDG
jgi:hypothetical protein